MGSQADPYPVEPKMGAFLTHLAVEGRVAPATCRPLPFRHIPRRGN